MRNHFFALLLSILLSTITVAGIWAQNLPGSIWSSPQSTTTEGRYRSNADDFIRPDSYANVKFEDWFGLTAFQWDPKTTKAVATAGYATHAGDMYIGAFYTGNFWTEAPGKSYTKRELGTAPTGGTANKVYTVYPNTPSVDTGANPVNNVALLFGVADMGFRLTYRTNYQSFNKSDIVVNEGTTTPSYQVYKNYQVETGYIAPQIAWAMAKDLTSNGIRPYATVDLVFQRDYVKTEKAGGAPSGVQIKNSKNSFDPALGLGLGGYTFFSKDSFKSSFDVDYVLTLNIYDNEYSYTEGGAYKTGKINGTYGPGAGSDYLEKSFASNLLTPSLSGSWSNERVGLKFKLNLPLTLYTDESNSMDLNSSNKLIYSGPSNTITTFSFMPDIRLAMQFKAIPDRLNLNVGARIQTTAIVLETTLEKQYTNGTKVSTTESYQESYGGDLVSGFNLGATFYFTENIWVEAVTGVSKAFGDEAVDVFAPGGLFSFGSILFALKF